MGIVHSMPLVSLFLASRHLTRSHQCGQLVTPCGQREPRSGNPGAVSVGRGQEAPSQAAAVEARRPLAGSDGRGQVAAGAARKPLVGDRRMARLGSPCGQQLRKRHLM
ncbi:hypothetical protein Dimus_007660 [Dionaea muscipula]